MRKGTALVVGATGITGGNLASYLVASGWTVYGLSRRTTEQSGVIPVAADLLDKPATEQALAGLPITHVFYCTWIRRDNEKANVEANSQMMRNLFAALDSDKLDHASLVTGTKQYLGSFEAYGSGRIETPFRESEPRVPGDNFYYALEDVLFEAAEHHGFAWNVHRPHTVIGYARGNAMNMGTTIAVYASICQATGQPFVFPGSQTQWNALTDMTDALVLARQMEWAATTPGAANQAFNTVNGDVFRWRRMWREIGEYFGLEVQGPEASDDPETMQPLETQMAGAESTWREIAEKHDLVEPDVAKLASWWHTDADLGRDQECVNDTTKSRDFGFDHFRETRAAFFDLFDRLRAEKVIP
ncbi:SDR family oxidoreductase [Chromohalobacter sp. TMW 2.2308]|uniref:SDR family oxidoreductase n=1 Tax=Chromohalobacter TaxID=42054 RepID=UPI001FFCE412|nr:MULTISPECIES: SDR family oxidoreductase [Chromohalobacter]MCK2043446.1 SDR family oxidoreductase [Chromohalobacter moromii]MCT8515318.1 SDR family oxidoreductase [Chromohalobacter sp. TMW 2.2271]